MPPTGPRRPLLKRACLWTAAAMLGLASYFAGAPAISYLIAFHAPALTPITQVVYAPLESFVDTDLPGSKLYVKYVEWSLRSLGVEAVAEPE